MADNTPPMTEEQVRLFIRRQVMKAIGVRQMTPKQLKLLDFATGQLRNQWMQDRQRALRALGVKGLRDEE